MATSLGARVGCTAAATALGCGSYALCSAGGPPSGAAAPPSSAPSTPPLFANLLGSAQQHPAPQTATIWATGARPDGPSGGGNVAAAAAAAAGSAPQPPPPPPPLPRARVHCGACAIQGKRSHMEDRWAAVSDGRAHHAFGVFDGHGGARCSTVAAAELPQRLFGALEAQGLLAGGGRDGGGGGGEGGWGRWLWPWGRGASLGLTGATTPTAAAAAAAAAAAGAAAGAAPHRALAALHDALAQFEEAFLASEDEAVAAARAAARSTVLGQQQQQGRAWHHKVRADFGSGSTACVALLTAPPPAAATATPGDADTAQSLPHELLLANIGDSRAVLCRRAPAAAAAADGDGTLLEVLPLSSDHKPELPAETARVEAAGGQVRPLMMGGRGPLAGTFAGPPRVFTRDGQGGLAMSRALGDIRFKRPPFVPSGRPLVVATPDVARRSLSTADAFLVIGSDGLWDTVSNERACDFVARRLLLGEGGGGDGAAQGAARVQAAAAGLVELAYAAGSSDNICAMIVHFDWQPPQQPGQQQQPKRQALGEEQPSATDVPPLSSNL
jgi:serine/threonine protein phosphatase PrpC